jgi:predicted Zn-dependent protease with MMP-like domain
MVESAVSIERQYHPAWRAFDERPARLFRQIEDVVLLIEDFHFKEICLRPSFSDGGLQTYR